VDKAQPTPRRNRALYLTLEVCRNISTPPNGAIELIVSSVGSERAAFHLWPLDDQGSMTVAQLNDLTSVMTEHLTNTLLGRLTIQAELFNTP
jgi:hypothetical protein